MRVVRMKFQINKTKNDKTNKKKKFEKNIRNRNYEKIIEIQETILNKVGNENIAENKKTIFRNSCYSNNDNFKNSGEAK